MVQASDYFCFWKVSLDLHPLSQTVTNQQTSGIELPGPVAQGHSCSIGPPSAMITAAEKRLKRGSKATLSHCSQSVGCFYWYTITPGPPSCTLSEKHPHQGKNPPTSTERVPVRHDCVAPIKNVTKHKSWPLPAAITNRSFQTVAIKI